MKMDVSSKFNKLVDEYGVQAINLCIERHDLSSHKRTLWTIQFALYKENERKNKLEIEKYKTEIQELTEKIEEIDQKLLNYGITDKNRPSIIKIVKQANPDSWFGGFTKN